MQLVWFRQDLRLSDNPALNAAARSGTVLPVYILDDENADDHKMGAASRVWLYHALDDLEQNTDGALRFFKGDAVKILKEICEAHQIESVHWNRCYEPWRIRRDKGIKEMLCAMGVEVHSYNGSLLWEPWEIENKSGKPYKVFTPYYKKGCLNAPPPREPKCKPDGISYATILPDGAVSLDDLALLPDIAWHKRIEEEWDMSEAGAVTRLRDFLDEDVENYKEGRDFPAMRAVSRLSPYLHFGMISPHKVWYEAMNKGQSRNVEHFHMELAWREFSYSMLYYFPQLPEKNLNGTFDAFPWRSDEGDRTLEAWKLGQTGYPIVDAGMRELWQTGYMHNRVRMIVGSFLVKNLLFYWQEGERWFWDCLVDADLANNSASWQWVAGGGADAAPYFRIFNPVTQGERFDPEGEYTRKYVPELVDMPDKYLFKPWDAPEEVLAEAGVILGDTYPQPVVDLKASRERALEAFKSLKG